MDDMKKNKTMWGIIIAVVVVIVLVVGGLALWHGGESDDDKKDEEDTEMVVSEDEESDEETEDEALTEAEEAEAEAAALLEQLATVPGTYTGTTSAVTPLLQFPTSTLVVSAPDPEGALPFTMTADGLSLAALNDPALQINGVYPTVSLEAAGVIVVGESFTANFTSLSPVFAVEVAGVSTPLDAATSAVLAEGLATQGIVIPTASPEATLAIDLVPTFGEDSLAVESAPDSEFYVAFEGTK